MGGAPCPPRVSGFTLIEMLIALTLIALIITLLFSAIRLGNRSWESTEFRTERSAGVRLIWRFLGQQINQARPILRQEAGRERRMVFYGLDDALELVAPSPPGPGGGGLYLMRIAVDSGNGKKRLLLGRWLYQGDVLEGGGGVPVWRSLSASHGPPPETTEGDRSLYSQTVLIDSLESIKIDYFGLRRGRKEPAWGSEWKDEPVMPLLVKMQIRDQTGDWPEMVWTLFNEGR